MDNFEDEAFKFISKEEGCRLMAYPDPISGGDPWTIGYGATGPGIHKGVTWTQDMADFDLRDRIKGIGGYIDSLVKVSLSCGQKVALADFIYNLGLNAFIHSTLLKVLNNGDYTSAAAQLLRWDHAGSREVDALKERRQREKQLFERDIS